MSPGVREPVLKKFETLEEKKTKHLKYKHLASVNSSYPTLSKYVNQHLIAFAPTWLCESGFSAMSLLETKCRNRMDVEHDIHLCLKKDTAIS